MRGICFGRVFERFADAYPLSIAIVLHFLIVLVMGAVVLHPALEEPPDFRSEAGFLIENAGTEDASPPPSNDLSEFSKKQAVDFEIPQTVQELSVTAITVNSPTPTAFSLPAASAPAVLTPGAGLSSATAGRGGDPLGTGMGRGGRAGQGDAATFFGIRADSSRTAYMLDMSGTMHGPTKLALLDEFERTLSSLPDGAQVMVICWSGVAWQPGQQAGDVKGFWTRVSVSEYAMKPGMVPPPQWITLSPATRSQLLADLDKTRTDEGATDWRSPFGLLALASPLPEQVFFMSDGQLFTEGDKPFLTGIASLLRSMNTAPKVNVVAFPSARQKPEWIDALRSLSRRHGGKFTQIELKPGTPERR